MLMNATMMFVMLILTVPTLLRIYESHIFETADKDVNESDPCSNVHYLGSSGNKA